VCQKRSCGAYPGAYLGNCQPRRRLRGFSRSPFTKMRRGPTKLGALPAARRTPSASQPFSSALTLTPRVDSATAYAHLRLRNALQPPLFLPVAPRLFALRVVMAVEEAAARCGELTAPALALGRAERTRVGRKQQLELLDRRDRRRHGTVLDPRVVVGVDAEPRSELFLRDA
jgi:hypothetical protein